MEGKDTPGTGQGQTPDAPGPEGTPATEPPRADHTVEDAEIVGDATPPGAPAGAASPDPDSAPAPETPAVAAPAEGEARPAGEPEAAMPPAAEPEPAATPAAAAAEPADDHPTHAEEEHRSLASRVLTLLVAVIVGGALFLWAAPRVAPHLPAGLAPVADWLMPGARDQAAALDALRAELSARIEAIRPGLAEDELAARIETRVEARAAAAETAAAAALAAARAEIAARIASLSDQVRAGDSGALESRLAQVETRAQGLLSELTSLKGALSGLEKSDGVITAETSARIAAFAASVDGLRGEFDALAAKLGAITQRIDEVEAASLRRETEAAERAKAVADAAEAEQRAAARQAALAALRGRIDAGEPFVAELAEAARATGRTAPPALAAVAAEGIPTLDALRAMVPEAAHAAIRATIRSGTGDDVLSRATSFFEARIATRSLEAREGSDVDAVLSRFEARLAADDIPAALAEAAALPPEAAAAMEGVLAALRARGDVLAALAELSAAPAVTN